MRKSNVKLTFVPGDIVVIVCVIALAVFVGIFFGKKLDTKEESMVAVYKDGKKVQEFSLDQDREILLEYDYTNKVVVKDRKVAITESDCPGEDCVHSGWLGQGGRSLVCLPNRVEIRLEGESEVDFIVR